MKLALRVQLTLRAKLTLRVKLTLCAKSTMRVKLTGAWAPWRGGGAEPKKQLRLLQTEASLQYKTRGTLEICSPRVPSR